MKLKPIDELTFTDDYMFKEVVTRNLNIAKKIVEFALKRKVKDIHLAGTEVEKQGSYLTKKTRYDVLLEGEDAWIVIEMQTEKKTDYPLRIRTYHVHLAEEDMKLHKDYKDMKENIVIFICTEDYFGEKQPVYTFGTMETTLHLPLDEKRTTIFINPDGDTDDEEIKAFLKYLKEGTVTDDFTKEIEDTVTEIKDNQDFRGSYMTLEEKYKDFRDDGYKEGKEEGIKQGKEEGIQEEKNETCKNALMMNFELSAIQN